MLAVRKRNIYNFNEQFIDIELNNISKTYNNFTGGYGMGFEYDDDEGYFIIKGFTPGIKHFFHFDLTIDQGDEWKEGILQIDSASYMYFNTSTKQMESSYTPTTSEVKITVSGLLSKGIATPVIGWINSIKVSTNQWNEVDIEEDSIKLTSSIKLTNDLSKIQTAYSNQFDIFLNKTNIDALELHPDYLHNFNNTRTIFDMRLNLSDIHFYGNLEIISIKYVESGAAVATVNLFSKLNEFINNFEGKKINELSLSTFNYNINDMQNHIYRESTTYPNVDYRDKTYCYILHDWGQNINKSFLNQSNNKSINKKHIVYDVDYGDDSINKNLNNSYNYDGLGTDYGELFVNNFKPAMFAAKIFKQIHEESGYILKGDFLTTDAFYKLLVLPSNFENKDLDIQRNYFKLETPLTPETWEFTGAGGGVDIRNLRGLVIPEYDNGCVVYPYDTYTSQDAIYGGFNYDVELKVSQAGGGTTDIGDVESTFTIQYKDIGTVGNKEFVQNKQATSIIGTNTTTLHFSGSVRDIYIPSSNGGYNNINFTLETRGYSGNLHTMYFEVIKFEVNNIEQINNKIAPTTTHPIVDLLPDMTQLSFIKSIVTMFNLYVEFDNNIVTYRTRDEYFGDGDIVELTTADIKETNLLLPSNYVKNFYKFNYTQDDRGEISKYNSKHYSKYGNLDIKIGHNFSEEQIFEIPFGIVYQNEFINDSSLVPFKIGRSSENSISEDRETFSGNYNTNYYNDYEMPSQALFGVFDYELYPNDVHYQSLRVKDEKLSIIPTPCSGFPLIDCGILWLVNRALSNDIHFENLYTTYWRKEIDNITNITSNKIEVDVYLSSEEYAKMNLNNIIRFENGYYYIEQISDWNETNICKIILLKKTDNPFFS